MKKVSTVVSAGALAVLLAACGGNNNEEATPNNATDNNDANTTNTDVNEGNEAANNGEGTTIVVGASAVPHAEILEEVAPILAEQGITLEVEVFTDYVLPNITLENGEIDANYFQTPGYLESQIAESDYDFTSLGTVHAEPIGVYSQEYGSLDELPDGATIIISDSVSDHGRILPIFEREGLIELGNEEGTLATLDDITANEKNLDFTTQIEARLLASSFENGEGDAVVINTNYALEGNVDIDSYGIAFEGQDVLQPNLVVVRTEDQDREELNALVEVLQSEEIQSFIEERYEGAVISYVE